MSRFNTIHSEHFYEKDFVSYKFEVLTVEPRAFICLSKWANQKPTTKQIFIPIEAWGGFLLAIPKIDVAVYGVLAERNRDAVDCGNAARPRPERKIKRVRPAKRASPESGYESSQEETCAPKFKIKWKADHAEKASDLSQTTSTFEGPSHAKR